jgi:hypothetical protein
VKIQQPAVGLALVVAVGLGACNTSPVPTPTTAPAATTTSVVPVSGAALVKSAVESVEAARSVEVESTVVEGNGPSVQAAIPFYSHGSFAGAASVSIVSGPTITTYLRVIGDREYVMGSSLLWMEAGYSANAARELAARWAVARVGIKGTYDSTLSDVTAAVPASKTRV